MKRGWFHIHLARTLLFCKAVVMSGIVVACVDVTLKAPPAQDVTSTAPPAQDVTPTTSPARDVTPTVPPAQDVVVEYHQSGGFVGLDDHLTIYADRSAVLARRDGYYEFVLDEEDLNHIIELLDQAEFLALEDEYLPADTGADLIAYTISYGGHIVRAMDTAVPASVQPILDALYTLVDAEGRS